MTVAKEFQKQSLDVGNCANGKLVHLKYICWQMLYLISQILQKSDAIVSKKNLIWCSGARL